MYAVCIKNRFRILAFTWKGLYNTIFVIHVMKNVENILENLCKIAPSFGGK